jgi:hypothetical protein
LPPAPFSEDFAFLFALAVTVAVVAINQDLLFQVRFKLTFPNHFTDDCAAMLASVEKSPYGSKRIV